MLKLKNECEQCNHCTVCKYKNNARFAMAKLKETKFTKDDKSLNWEDAMISENVDIIFSCPNYETKGGICR